jgi:hypothetical protein
MRNSERTASPFSQSARKVSAAESPERCKNETCPSALCDGSSNATPRLTVMWRVFSSRVNLIALVMRFLLVSQRINI